MNKTKVLHISTPSTWRGGEQQLAYLAEGAQLHEAFVYCPENSELQARLKIDPNHVFTFKSKSTLGRVNELKHDKIILKEGISPQHLNGDLLHYTFHSTEQHQQQIEKFSTIAAEAKFRKGEKANWIKIYIKSVAKWLRTFVVKSGFKDGKLGLYLANSSYKATYLKYLKLKSLHEQN